jgi:hypothetical protein
MICKLCGLVIVSNAALQKIPQEDVERLMDIATGAGLIEVEMQDDPDAVAETAE